MTSSNVTLLVKRFIQDSHWKYDAENGKTCYYLALIV